MEDTASWVLGEAQRELVFPTKIGGSLTSSAIGKVALVDNAAYGSGGISESMISSLVLGIDDK